MKAQLEILRQSFRDLCETIKQGDVTRKTFLQASDIWRKMKNLEERLACHNMHNIFE